MESCSILCFSSSAVHESVFGLLCPPGSNWGLQSAARISSDRFFFVFFQTPGLLVTRYVWVIASACENLHVLTCSTTASWLQEYSWLATMFSVWNFSVEAFGRSVCRHVGHRAFRISAQTASPDGLKVMLIRHAESANNVVQSQVAFSQNMLHLILALQAPSHQPAPVSLAALSLY
jgi:hypothetical protein